MKMFGLIILLFFHTLVLKQTILNVFSSGLFTSMLNESHLSSNKLYFMVQLKW